MKERVLQEINAYAFFLVFCFQKMNEARKTEVLHEACSAFRHYRSQSPSLKLLLERIRRNEGDQGHDLVYSSTATSSAIGGGTMAFSSPTKPIAPPSKWREKLHGLIAADSKATRALILEKKLLKRKQRLKAKLRENIVTKMTIRTLIRKVNKMRKLSLLVFSQFYIQQLKSAAQPNIRR